MAHHARSRGTGRDVRQVVSGPVSGIDSETAAEHQARMQATAGLRRKRLAQAHPHLLSRVGLWLLSFAFPSLWLKSVLYTLVLIALVTAVTMTFDWVLTGVPPARDGPQVVIVSWLVVLIAGAIKFFFWRSRRARHRERLAALTALTRPFGAKRCRRFDDWAEWIRTYWAGDIDVHDISPGLVSCAASIELDGYPALVLFGHSITFKKTWGLVPDIRPRLSSPSSPWTWGRKTTVDKIEPNVVILVACAATGHGVKDGDASSEADDTWRVDPPAEDLFSRLGVSVSFSDCGLRATVTGAVVEGINGNSQAREELQSAMVALAQACAAAGKKPAPPFLPPQTSRPSRPRPKPTAKAAWLAALGLGLAAAGATAALGSPSRVDAAKRWLKDYRAERLQARCRKSDERACEVFRAEGVDAEIRELEAGCRNGEGASCRKLGGRYANGKGVTADRTRAAELYERGCDHGDPAGCYLVGTYYSLGRGGMEVDAEQALELFRLACRKSAEQCFMVGGVYEHGRAGAPVDEALALEFYRESCDRGHEPACREL